MRLPADRRESIDHCSWYHDRIYPSGAVTPEDRVFHLLVETARAYLSWQRELYPGQPGGVVGEMHRLEDVLGAVHDYLLDDLQRECGQAAFQAAAVERAGVISG